MKAFQGFKNSKSLLIATLLLIFVSVFTINQLLKGEERDYVEISEYEGTKLSSAKDFRKNSIKGSQEVNIEEYRLKVTGMVGIPKEYTYEDVLNKFKSKEKVVTLECVEGWSATVLWEGVSVEDLVRGTRPSPKANTVIFHAIDGYTTSLPIEYLYDNDIILAYKINRITLPKENGFPFQLVAESKWGYKWIKWVVELEFSDDEDYRGFWESRGYSINADLDKPFWEK